MITDTTLLVHFFGRKGRDVLKYDDFFRFVLLFLSPSLLYRGVHGGASPTKYKKRRKGVESPSVGDL